jgi:hypothetical protein
MIMPSILLLAAISCRTNREFASTPDFETFTSPIEIEFRAAEGANFQKLNGRVHILRNNIVSISFLLPLIGSEAARISLTPDSLTVIDRINRTFAVEPVELLAVFLPSNYTFENLQKKLTTAPVISFKTDQLEMNIRVLRPSFNDKLTLDTALPSKYRRISLDPPAIKRLFRP